MTYKYENIYNFAVVLNEIMGLRYIGFYQSILLIMVIVTMGCQEKSDISTSQRPLYVDSNVKYVDSVFILSDTFSQIKRGLCNSDMDSLTEYTNENSSYIPFDILDPTATFIYLSNVDCGVPGGTCGDYISIINRKSNDVYHQKIQVCGVLDSVDFRTMQLYYSSIVERKQYVVDLSTEMPTVEYLSINHIPVSEIEFMSNDLNVMAENLVFDEEPTDNLDAISVRSKISTINDHLKVVVYELNMNSVPYAYAFLRLNNKFIKNQQLGGVGSMSNRGSGSNVEIKYDSGHQVVYYSVDLEKKSFVKK